MTNLTKMQIDKGSSEPVSQKPYPITMVCYDWDKNEINKGFDTKVLHSSHSSWSAFIIIIILKAMVENTMSTTTEP